MRAFWKKHWFLITLTLLLMVGIAEGVSGHAPAVRRWTWFFPPQATTACVMALMSFTLENRQLQAAWRAPGAVLLACLVNCGLAPVLAWWLMRFSAVPDFAFGLMVVGSIPCTVASASVLTRKGGGNDAIALLTTLTTNLLCFVITPLWLKLTTGRTVHFDPVQVGLSLLLSALVPTVFGQLLRRRQEWRAFADSRKGSLSVVALIMIELMVHTAALEAGAKWREMSQAEAALLALGGPAAAEPGEIAGHLDFAGAISAHSQADGSRPGESPGERKSAPPVPRVRWFDLVVIWGCGVLIHVSCMLAGWRIARKLSFPRVDAIAVAFAGSQKTLPLGILVTSLFSLQYPFALFPMLLFHTTQLFLDSAVADWFALSPDSSLAVLEKQADPEREPV